MASNDTLNLSGFKPKSDRPLPIAAVETINHPEAVKAARARIAALPETFPLESHDAMPSVATHKLVTDKEKLRHTLAAEPLPKRHIIPSLLQPVLTAVGIFLLILAVFKAPVILSQLGFAFNKPSAPVTASQATAAVIPAEPTITIPKINVHAPVVYEPSTNEAAFQTALQSGVVHYANTAVPGQNGNVAIFGHSSNDWWEPGNFKFVFVLLDKLAPGDKITIDYQSKRYTYEVTGSQVVLPTDVQVLNQTPTPTLSLITCTPPGTSWKRLVVTAKQVDPNPDSAPTPTPTPVTATSASNLSSAQPGLLKQLGSAWNGIVHGIGSLFGTDNKSADPTTPAAANQPATLPASN